MTKKFNIANLIMISVTLLLCKVAEAILDTGSTVLRETNKSLAKKLR